MINSNNYFTTVISNHLFDPKCTPQRASIMTAMPGNLDFMFKRFQTK
jgi:hypothetical protein